MLNVKRNFFILATEGTEKKRKAESEKCKIKEVASRAPSFPTALTYGDGSTLKTPSFCLDNG